MLYALLFALSSDPMISLECPGRPLSEVLPKLAEQAHAKLYLSKEVENLSIVLRVRNKPWPEVKKRLAWAVRGSWIDSGGNWTLTRTKADKDAEVAERQKATQKIWDKYLDEWAKATRGWGAWSDQDLKQLIESDSLQEPPGNMRTIARQAAFQLALLVGAETLTKIPAGSYFADPPRAGELPFPNGSKPILQNAYAAYTRHSELTNDKTAPPVQAVLRPADVEHLSWTLYFADARGMITDREQIGTRDTAPIGQPWKSASEEPLKLSPRAANFIEVAAAAFQLKPKTMLPELVDALNDPVAVDPIEVAIGEVLLRVAEQRDEDLIAVPQIGSGIFALRRTTLPLTEQHAVGALRRLNTIQSANGWLELRGTNSEQVPPRATMRNWVRGWHAEKTSQDYALRLWNDFLGTHMQPLVMYGTQRWFNKGLGVGGSSGMIDWDQPLWRAIDPTRPFHDVIALTSEQREALWQAMLKDPEQLELLASGNELMGGSVEGSEPNESLYTLTAQSCLELLPKRAFPEGLPKQAEIKFKPDATSDDCLMSEDDNIQHATRMSTYSYGLILKDLRSGARTSGPKYFGGTSRVGGSLKITFGRMNLSFSQYASALVLGEKGRPLSELPADFVKQAQVESEATQERTVVPPRSR